MVPLGTGVLGAWGRERDGRGIRPTPGDSEVVSFLGWADPGRRKMVRCP